MSNATLINRKNLSKAIVAVAALLVTVGVFTSVAYAATIHGTDGHDWGKAKDDFADPPNCGVRRGEMIHGTGGADTIYGHKGWDYVGAEGGDDVVHGGLGMEIIQGSGATIASSGRGATTTSSVGAATTEYTWRTAGTSPAT